MQWYMKHQATMHIKRNIATYFFVVLIFMIGIVLGAAAVRILPEEQKAELIGYLGGFLQNLHSGSHRDFYALWSTALLNHAKAIVLIWLLGFTIIGIPFVLCIVFVRGFIIGFTVGFLISEYVMKGLVFALTAVVPHNLLAIPALIITAVCAVKFSLQLVKRKKQTTTLLADSLWYSVICLLMLTAALTAGLVEVYISPVFMKLIVDYMMN